MSSEVVRDIRSHTAPRRNVRWSPQIVLNLIVLSAFHVTLLTSFHIGRPI